MTGWLLARRDNGTVTAVEIDRAIRIGSGADNELPIDGDGVLPVHAKAGVSDGEYWIQDAGSAGVLVNGETATERRTLHHLDVITVGDDVNLIFSTTAAPLQNIPRPKRPPAPSASPAPPANVTVAFDRTRAPPPAFAFPEAEENFAVPNTAIGVQAGGPMPLFQPASADAAGSPENTVIGTPVSGPAPQFAPARSVLVTSMLARTDAPAFNPEETRSIIKTAPVVRPIAGVRLSGPSGVFETSLGRSVVGRAADAGIRIDRKNVSKVHALVMATPTEVTVEDQRSVNGTAVNGTPTSGPQRLVEGDRVSFATFEFRVEFLRMDGSE